ncbi:uncharacterized protein [Macrobrachium rosenbergii]|uniref:uncharacterized protein n=1 Tax=Macrobrachium rosenbergii TaxID=79674 RepID=UPI0034D3C2EC
MGDRDERGRLKLPDPSYVPFQRVLSRSNRGSINNSRRESPEHTPRKKSNRQWASSESKRSTRSHSYNISEYRNSHDDNHHGYYYDGDHENNEDKHRRRRAKHRDHSREMTKKLNDLSLRNGGRPRSKSLTNGSENHKMPFIPFQRVLNIRTRQPTIEPEKTFRVPAYTICISTLLQNNSIVFSNRGLKDRRDFHYKRDKFRPNGYTTEYRSRFMQQHGNSYAKKKPSRGKNDSHLNELLTEKDSYNQSDDEYEYKNGDDHERSNHSRLSKGSKHSGGSYGSDDGNASGYEDRTDSSSSVKFPQIRPSPTVSAEVAKTIKGKGAAAPPRNLTMSPQSISSANQVPLFVQDTIQAIDTSRWVEGKGAGRLSHYFKPMIPQTKSDKLNINQETVKIIEDTDKNKEKKAELNKALNILPKVHSKKTSSQREQNKSQKIAQNTNQIRSKNITKFLPRSKSDSALFHANRNENNTQGHIQKMKSNQIIIFKENEPAQSIQRGERPRSSLPKIILTMAEDQNSPKQKKFLEKSITKNIQKGTYIRTAIPNLPNISVTEKDKEHYMSSTKNPNIQPKSPQLQQKLNNKQLENSIKKNRLDLKRPSRTMKKPSRIKKKSVIATQHKPYKNKQIRKTKEVKNINHTINREELLQSHPIQKQNLLQVTNHHLDSASLKRKVYREMNITRRFSINNNNVPQVHRYTFNEKLPSRPDQGNFIELKGSYNQDDIQKYIGNIKQQRSKRLEKFSHFLRPKERTGEVIL